MLKQYLSEGLGRGVGTQRAAVLTVKGGERSKGANEATRRGGDFGERSDFSELSESIDFT